MGRNMAGPKNRVETAETEAAQWYSRLGERSVENQTVKDFFEWRKAPANDDAYRRVERAWGKSRELAGDPAMRDALTEVLSRKTRRTSSDRGRRLIIGVAALGATATLAFAGWSWLEARTVFATSVGEQRLVQLADGSSVRLDTDSRMRVRFDGRRRLIELETGQALFIVAHDAKRPFVVTAGDARVTAIGTVFDVRRRDREANVTLVSGVVDVAGGGKTERMTAGHQARITQAGPATTAIDADAETSWTTGRIIFRDTPLSEAVTEINRYLTAKVELDARSLASEPVNGVFKTGDRDAFVSTASEVFGLQVAAGPDGSVRLSERGK
jgi:transmembrane sensor